jgi:transcriptional regulator with XRE-family HTH domain
MAVNRCNRSNSFTGLDLKFARLTRGVQAREVARSLGVSPQRVSAIEAVFRPSVQMVARYLAALDSVAPPENAGRQIEQVNGPDREVQP